MTALISPVRLMFGLPVDPVTLAEAVEICRQAVHDHRRLLVGVVNAAKVVNLRRDPALREAIISCDLLLADGQSIVWAGDVLDSPLPERVTGIDLFGALLDVADAEHLAVYLLGAKPEVVQELGRRIGVTHPGARLVGVRDGYFTDAEIPDVVADICQSGADMLFLGMSSPRKETFLATYADELCVPVLHGVGGSFDVLAGLTRRAPVSWQRHGLEWAYRLVQEPRRLWRRYLSTNTRFVWQVAKERVRPTPPLSSSPNHIHHV
jgi:N-acetylglucosaminyldiphosphoundecaprenol N-acetyl-beta-D-mannosaminyltransferase